MAAAAEAPAAAAAPSGAKPSNSNRIQVSSSKKPIFFYVGLSKRLLAEHGEVHLSALGLAVSTLVSIAEILKKDGLVETTRLATCMESLGEDEQRPVQKAKMEAWLKKSAQFDELIAAEREKNSSAAANGEAAAAADAGEGEADEEEHEEGDA